MGGWPSKVPENQDSFICPSGLEKTFFVGFFSLTDLQFFRIVFRDSSLHAKMLQKLPSPYKGKGIPLVKNKISALPLPLPKSYKSNPRTFLRLFLWFLCGGAGEKKLQDKFQDVLCFSIISHTSVLDSRERQRGERERGEREFCILWGEGGRIKGVAKALIWMLTTISWRLKPQACGPNLWFRSSFGWLGLIQGSTSTMAQKLQRSKLVEATQQTSLHRTCILGFFGFLVKFCNVLHMFFWMDSSGVSKRKINKQQQKNETNKRKNNNNRYM